MDNGEVRQQLDQALALARAGDNPACLQVLDAALAAAPNQQSVSLLARHASVVAENAGELRRAQVYLRTALQANANDPWLHLAFADISLAVGDSELFAAHLQRCKDLACSLPDAELLEVLEKRGV